MLTVTALAFDETTRKWTKPVEYKARDRMEAIRWARCNQDYLFDIRIEGEGFSIPLGINGHKTVGTD